jgi:pimeloyl-ACP methyl ester carboxylesterase
LFHFTKLKFPKGGYSVAVHNPPHRFAQSSEKEIPMLAHFIRSCALAAAAAGVLGIASGLATAETPAAAMTDTHYRTARIDGVEVAYREAGPTNGPAVLLLHGFPTSSRMFRNLIPTLADRYHVIAPDYPGFGRSPAPGRETFAYTFAAYAKLVDGLVAKLGVQRYALYVQDYGAPVGYRLALAHPERITAMVIQNGNAYETGLGLFWNPIRAYWAEPSPEKRNALRAGLTSEATRSQYIDGVADSSHIDPENWQVDQVLLDRPGIDEVMLDLFYDYRTNASLYPQFQAFFRTRQPPTLIVWGKNDVIFPAEGARAYLRDLPRAELHLLDSGHFALEDKGAEIAGLMRSFLDRSFPR